MLGTPEVAPLLSTPADHIFEDNNLSKVDHNNRLLRSDEQIYVVYEIERTLDEIRKGKWSRIALQFPDEMLPDAPKVFELLRSGLRASHFEKYHKHNSDEPGSTEVVNSTQPPVQAEVQARPYILADTSYGSCCVDEIASEHIGADVVVHYGRSCLSPTARLPVIYVFTKQSLDIETVVTAFEETYVDRTSQILLMADIPYASHLPSLHEALVSRGYMNIFCTDLIHDPSSALPNRTLPSEGDSDLANLRDWELFHVADPPEALLLTLSSRVSRIHIYPTPKYSAVHPKKPLLASTARALSRRYALLTSVTTVPIFGILINTLSVKNYIHIVEHVKSQILAAGKKSYTFVVGKINAAKVANFSEIGAWVVIGCWESSLIESKDFWKPVITPFELELTLARDDERVWTGKWSSNFQEILNVADKKSQASDDSNRDETGTSDMSRTLDKEATTSSEEIDSEEDSAPPDFDLRTGRLVSQSRPMQPSLLAAGRKARRDQGPSGAESALVQRAKGDMAVIGGAVSPGAEFLRSQRTWRGLGTDFEIAYEDSQQASGTAIEEGQRGIARGYVHGDNFSKS